MTSAYIRVSSDKSTVENQKFEITNYCSSHNIHIDNWIEEVVTGTKDPSKRKLGILLKNLGRDDLIICSEISRLGRNLFMIMDILSYCMEHGITVQTIKDNFFLRDDIQTKVLAFAFGLSAEIERNMISQRTTEALARKKAEGIKLGRPVGSKNKTVKLSGKDETIKELVKQGQSYSAIARIFHVDRSTVERYTKERGIFIPKKYRKKTMLQTECCVL